MKVSLTYIFDTPQEVQEFLDGKKRRADSFTMQGPLETPLVVPKRGLRRGWDNQPVNCPLCGKLLKHARSIYIHAFSKEHNYDRKQALDLQEQVKKKFME